MGKGGKGKEGEVYILATVNESCILESTLAIREGPAPFCGYLQRLVFKDAFANPRRHVACCGERF